MVMQKENNAELICGVERQVEDEGVVLCRCWVFRCRKSKFGDFIDKNDAASFSKQ